MNARPPARKFVALAIAVAALTGGLAVADPSATNPADAPSAAAKATVTLDALLTDLGKSAGISANFSETKRISLLKTPLIDTGSVYFMPPSLLARHVDSPRRSVVVLDGNRLTFADKDGVHHLDLAGSPMAGVLVSSLVTVLVGDRAALEQRFDMKFDASAVAVDEWRLSLVPRDARVKRVLVSLELAGKGLVLSRMILRDGNGDVTESTFDHVATDRRFSAAERARFFGIPASF